MDRMKLVYRNPADLRPSPRNARVHTEEQVNLLAGSLQRFGWRTAIVVDEAGRILAGHGRVLAAMKLGMTEVPTIIGPKMTEAEKRAYVIADNRLADMAGWDKNLLALELGDLVEVGFDAMELLGEIPEVRDASDEIPIVDFDTTTVRDAFWIVVQGPLAKQAEALSALQKVMAEFEEVTVSLGVREINDRVL